MNKQTKYIKYYYFSWKEGRPEPEELSNQDEHIYETPNSKDGVYDGWAFIVSNTKLTEKDVDFLETFDLFNGVTYELNRKHLKECTVKGNMVNIDDVVKDSGLNKSYIYKIRIKSNSVRTKLIGKFRARDTAYTAVGRLYKTKSALNCALRAWPLLDDEEIVMYEMRELRILSGTSVKYGIKK